MKFISSPKISTSTVTHLRRFSSSPPVTHCSILTLKFNNSSTIKFNKHRPHSKPLTVTNRVTIQLTQNTKSTFFQRKMYTNLFKPHVLLLKTKTKVKSFRILSLKSNSEPFSNVPFNLENDLMQMKDIKPLQQNSTQEEISFCVSDNQPSNPPSFSQMPAR